MTPVHLLYLSLDTDVFDSTSNTFLRHQANANYFAHTTILVLNRGITFKAKSLRNRDIIPVNARGKLESVIRAYMLASSFYKKHPYHLITCEDPLMTGLVGKWLKAKFHLPLNIQNPLSRSTHFWEKYVIKSNLKTADSTFSPISANLDRFFRPAHFHPRIKKIISIGDLTPLYKYTDLIDGFSQITKAHPESTLTIIGDGPEKNTLASQIVNLGLNDRIFLVGKKSPKDTAALLHQHDIFISTSSSIGWGEIICQAFASGLPIITVPTKDGEDLLQPNTNCLVASDTLSLVTCLLSLITHPEEVYRLAKNGQQWLSSNLESIVLPKYFALQLLQIIK